MQAFSYCSCGLLCAYLQIRHREESCINKSLGMTQHISRWDLACVVCEMQTAQFAWYLHHVAATVKVTKIHFCRDQPCGSLCQKKLTLRMWQGIPSFLLLSNVRDFLIWWSTQVAPHGGVCPQRVELPAFPPRFMWETCPVVSAVWQIVTITMNSADLLWED